MRILNKVRSLAARDLPMLLEWRNSDHVRKFMYSTHVIGPEEHARWYESISANARQHALIFEQDGEPLGFVKVGPVRAGGLADWGFYTAPHAGRGTGSTMCATALEYCFGGLRLHKISGECLAANVASIGLHRRLGFRQEGLLVDQHFDAGIYHDVVRFGLLADEWTASHLEART